MISTRQPTSATTPAENPASAVKDLTITALELAKASTYQKGDLAWYHRVSKDDLEKLASITRVELEKQLPMVLVRIVGVHHDDYPNIYYTIQQAEPLQTTDVAGAAEVGFVHEKQTDNYHLLPPCVNESNNDGRSASPVCGCIPILGW